MKSAEMVIVTAIRLISVPLFLIAWDKDLYGEWLVLSTLLTYFQMGNLGFAQTAANDMTIAVARDDREHALKVYQSTAVFLFAASAGVFLISFSITGFLPLREWMNLSMMSPQEVQICVSLFVGCVVMSFLMGLVMAGYRCEGKYHRGLLFLNLYIVLQFGGTVAVLLLGGGVTQVASAMLAARTLSFLAMVIDLRRVAPWIKLGISKASRKTMRSMLTPSLSFMSYPLSLAISNQGAVLAIGTIINPAAVVVFTAMRTLTNLVFRVYDLVNQAFYPEISMAWGKSDSLLMRKLHRTSSQASIWVGAAMTALLAILGPWIFELWTAGRVEYDGILLYGLLFTMLIRAVWYTSNVVPSAINKHQKIAVAFLASSVLSTVIFAALLALWSLHLALIGLASLELAMVVAVLPYALRLSEDSPKKYFLAVMRPPKPMAVVRAVLKRKATTTA